MAQVPHHVYGPVSIGYGDAIRVDLSARCNVIALPTYEYENYKRGRTFTYYGGYATATPVIIRPPIGMYYVVIDNGGSSYRLRASVSVIRRRGY